MTRQNKNSKGEQIIEVSCLGPISRLSGTLSRYSQNLIYAINGVGKSYLARVFYILEQIQRNNQIEYASEILLNHDSKQGSLSFIKRTESNAEDLIIGQLNFYDTNSYNAEPSDCIFHVFN